MCFASSAWDLLPILLKETRHCLSLLPGHPYWCCSSQDLSHNSSGPYWICRMCLFDSVMRAMMPEVNGHTNALPRAKRARAALSFHMKMCQATLPDWLKHWLGMFLILDMC